MLQHTFESEPHHFAPADRPQTWSPQYVQSERKLCQRVHPVLTQTKSVRSSQASVLRHTRTRQMPYRDYAHFALRHRSCIRVTEQTLGTSHPSLPIETPSRPLALRQTVVNTRQGPISTSRPGWCESQLTKWRLNDVAVQQEFCGTLQRHLALATYF